MHDLRSNWRMPRKRHGTAPVGGEKRRSDQAIGGRSGDVARVAAGVEAISGVIASVVAMTAMVHGTPSSAPLGDPQAPMSQPQAQPCLQCPSWQPSSSQSASPRSAAAAIDSCRAGIWTEAPAAGTPASDRQAFRRGARADADPTVGTTRKSSRIKANQRIDMGGMMANSKTVGYFLGAG
jgi:hypothetical protein